ncbi:pyruvate dehydrogenase complex subunit PDH-E3I [Cardiosporidium cionae]|uniref:Pyruvate dehydrogenase complex subunit PDH-E3I n=1 Tax=Cardiosporidium cionae TaxID=476202 RepID=A0ABQ7JC40_9APIC|nr:pyruvate dehydrogenase complex subunit PDH-E3I [Cardiosporidium cionae]|eukprot:KAF8821230.1 pyruvate dehydrogenase complex subunit PDH-E3I [Cardiosporidium cionae]
MSISARSQQGTCTATLPSLGGQFRCTQSHEWLLLKAITVLSFIIVSVITSLPTVSAVGPLYNSISRGASFPSSLPKCAETAPQAFPSAFLSTAASPVSSLPSFLQNSFAPSPASSLSMASSMTTPFDYDVAIIGGGVGGHGAALQAVTRGLKTVIFTGGDVGGTCVNRGCVPSKALLAAANHVRLLRNRKHLESFGISVDGPVNFDRKTIAGHAASLASKVRAGLTNSLKGHGIELVEEHATLVGPQTIQAGKTKIRAKDIILAPGSLPIVPRGIQVDGKTVFTSDSALLLEDIPEWVAIVGSGYIGLEFSDIFTALGSEVTFIEALPRIMPTFDTDIAKAAERLLIHTRPIDYRVGVFASEVLPGIRGKQPVTLRTIDSTTKHPVETLEVDACMVATGRSPNTKNLGLTSVGVETDRGFISVDDSMRVLPHKGSSTPLPHLYCIGDANGRMMLAHVASAQGISAIENCIGNQHTVNHEAIPAACFTHPEIAFVGLTEGQAKERAQKEGFSIGKAVSHFRANSKALAENEGGGIAKLIYRKDSHQLLGAHIIGMHASDLIQECANAMISQTSLKELAFNVHTHPTLSEVIEGAYKATVGMHTH